MKYLLLSTSLACVAVAAPSAWGADPWADAVVEYTQGAGVGADFVTGSQFNNPSVSLGEPTRYTSEPENFGGATTPLQSSFRATELVSIGRGGSLTVRFDEPVVDDPANPFGIDLLVFGNAFYFDANFPSGVAGALAAEGGMIEVSDDGAAYVAIPGVQADGLFPTLGYLDLTDPFATSPGAVPADFTRPVNPAFNPAGLGFAAIVAGYGGAGGGAGIDLAGTGLAQVRFVRITNPVGAAFVPEIDGFADVRAVPEPAGLLLLGATLAAPILLTRSRCRFGLC